MLAPLDPVHFNTIPACHSNVATSLGPPPSTILIACSRWMLVKCTVTGTHEARSSVSIFYRRFRPCPTYQADQIVMVPYSVVLHATLRGCTEPGARLRIFPFRGSATPIISMSHHRERYLQYAAVPIQAPPFLSMYRISASHTPAWLLMTRPHVIFPLRPTPSRIFYKSGLIVGRNDLVVSQTVSSLSPPSIVSD